MKKIKDFYIDLFEFCINKKGQFNYDDLIKSGLSKDKWKRDIIEGYLNDAYLNRRKLDFNEYPNYQTLFYVLSEVVILRTVILSI